MDFGIAGLGFLQNMTTPVAVGERVNVHVVPATKEPEPDYEAMRLILAGRNQKETQPVKDERTAR